MAGANTYAGGRCLWTHPTNLGADAFHLCNDMHGGRFDHRLLDVSGALRCLSNNIVGHWLDSLVLARARSLDWCRSFRTLLLCKTIEVTLTSLSSKEATYAIQSRSLIFNEL